MKRNVPEHLVCFSCRKQFRKPSRWNGVQPERRLYPHKIKENLVKDYPCPQCKSPMVNMGLYFKPPRRADKREWEQMQLLSLHGIRFGREGSVAFYQWLVRSVGTKGVISAWPTRQSAGQRLLQKLDRQKEQQGQQKKAS